MYERIDISYKSYIFYEMAVQMKLPIEKVILASRDKTFVAIENDCLAFDLNWFDQLEYKKILNVNHLLRYSMLLSFLNLDFNLSDLFLIPSKKIRFGFHNREISLNNLVNNNFKSNAILDFVCANMSRADIQAELDSFFVLLEDGYKEKFIQSLSHFQSISGVILNKREIAADILDSKRRNNFRLYMMTKLS